ncbi:MULTISPECIES: hypothetical protein [Oxalobacteraceae]|uniref:Phage protein n=1 Tax=Herminiimonas aquatilis TaxID=345342 RepID=A0ABW2J8Q0_9BURK|nr:hypothetical protein [Janthinobacterium sp. Marseille]
MTSTNIQDELNKAARLINAILRLMHKGAMKHDQARQELNALTKGIAKAEIEYCVRQAIKAVDINEQNLRVKDAEHTTYTRW